MCFLLYGDKGSFSPLWDRGTVRGWWHSLIGDESLDPVMGGSLETFWEIWGMKGRWCGRQRKVWTILPHALRWMRWIERNHHIFREKCRASEDVCDRVVSSALERCPTVGVPDKCDLFMKVTCLFKIGYLASWQFSFVPVTCISFRFFFSLSFW